MNNILEKYNYSEISNEQLAVEIGFNPEEVRMLKVYWEPTFNKGWIYLSPNMITQDMGYNRVNNFYCDTLRKHYQLNIDYKETSKDNPIIKLYEDYEKSLSAENSTLEKKPHTGGSAQKYYLVTGRAYKKMLMKARTKNGDKICEYYLKVEELAIQMRDYIGELNKYILTKELESSKKLLEEKDNIIKEKDEATNRIHKVNIELLTYKKLNEKNESIYIVATHRYATQGIFKIGRTKNMKARNSGHNNTHIVGDKVKILKEFKVNDSVLTENYIHKKLKGLLVNGEKEFFIAPYDLLLNIIEVIIHNDAEHNDLINSVIDTVNKLKYGQYNSEHWMSGIPEDTFREEMKLIVPGDADEPDEVSATFDVSNATEEQKKAFVARCIEAYQQTILEPQQQLVWKAFQAYLIQQLSIPKYKYKALQWRAIFNTAKSEIGQDEPAQLDSTQP